MSSGSISAKLRSPTSTSPLDEMPTFNFITSGAILSGTSDEEYALFLT